MTLHCLAATKIQIVTKVQTKKQVPNYKREASDTHNDQNWHPLCQFFHDYSTYSSTRSGQPSLNNSYHPAAKMMEPVKLTYWYMKTYLLTSGKIRIEL